MRTCGGLVVGALDTVLIQYYGVGGRVRRTRANWPVPVCTGPYQPGSNALNLNSNKLKIETKIPKNTSRFIEFNSVKFFPNLVRLVFFFVHYNISQKRKRKKIARPIMVHSAQR
jgi:hypothetical protein